MLKTFRGIYGKVGLYRQFVESSVFLDKWWILAIYLAMSLFSPTTRMTSSGHFTRLSAPRGDRKRFKNCSIYLAVSSFSPKTELTSSVNSTRLTSHVVTGSVSYGECLYIYLTVSSFSPTTILTSSGNSTRLTAHVAGSVTTCKLFLEV
jgi:hypothetical protein